MNGSKSPKSEARQKKLHELQTREAQWQFLNSLSNNSGNENNKKRTVCDAMTSPLALKMLNCNILFFVCVAILYRFSFFITDAATLGLNNDEESASTSESTSETAATETTETDLASTGLTISFIFSTLFVLPGLVWLFIILEFKLFRNRLHKYFKFFD